MATLAIQAGIAVGVSLLSGALAPKPKLQPVDRGKLDDIRFTVMEEGTFRPLAYGKRVRLGGYYRWGTETQEYVTSTPGRSGGKGGGSRQAEPPTNNFTYRKSFAVLFAGNRIKRYRRIWEDNEIILNLAGAEGVADSYEAEDSANTLTNASVANSTQFSGGRGVQLNTSTGAVQFGGVVGYGSATRLAFAYIASGTRTCQVWVNGSLAATVTLPGNSGAYSWYTSSSIVIPAGAGNTVKLVNTTSAGGALLYVDLLRITEGTVETPDPAVTGVVDDGSPYPSDLNQPHPFYNRYPANDSAGVATGTLTGGGQAPFEFYTGTETQLQSPTIVAVEGAANTPAWRGDSYVVFDDYLVKNGQLGNFTAEVEPYIQDLADVMTDLFTQDGRAAASEVDFSALAGTVPEGFVVHTRQDLGSWIDQLQLWYNFDVIPKGGKVVAVKRGGASAFTLTEEDLCARHENEEPPRGAVKRTIEDPADAPASADVLYLDYSSDKDFHTGAQQAQAQAGDGSYDRDTLTFAIVSDAETAAAVGRRYLDAKGLEQTPFEFSTGPKWRHLSPADVGTLQLVEATTIVRIVSRQAELQGLVKFRAVPERASLYNQLAPGLLHLGRETPVVEFPANTLLVVADCVALRQVEVGRLVVYAAGCPRGRGAWKGYALHREDLNGETERLGASQTQATIGIVETASNSTQTTGYEATRSFVVKLFSGSLESRTLDDVRAEQVNMAIYGSGSRWEVIQFLSAQAQAPTFPYEAQYLVTGTVTGLLGTENYSAKHQDGDYFILVDEGLQAFDVRPSDCGQPLTFVGQTFGQAFADAEDASSFALTLAGRSRQPLPISRVERDPGTGLAPRDVAGNIFVQVWPRTNADLVGDEYLIQLLSDDRLTVKREVKFAEGGLVPVLLFSAGGTKYGGVDANSIVVGGGPAAKPVTGFSAQRMRVDGDFVEATLTVSSGDFNTASLGLLVESAPSPFISVQLSTNGGMTSATLSVAVDGVNVQTITGLSFSKRIRLTATSTEVRVTDADDGEAAQPLYVLTRTIGLPVRAWANVFPTASFGHETRVELMTMKGGALPVIIITAALQQQYYGSLKSPLQVNIYQHSGVREIGYGPPWEGAI